MDRGHWHHEQTRPHPMTAPLGPSAEGRRRYPSTHGYMTELRDPIPCTCEPDCQSLCVGECGCEACKVLFSIFCDEAGCFPETAAELERAVWRYRGDPDR